MLRTLRGGIPAQGDRIVWGYKGCRCQEGGVSEKDGESDRPNITRMTPVRERCGHGLNETIFEVETLKDPSRQIDLGILK